MAKQPKELHELEVAEKRAERAIMLLARKMVPHFQNIRLSKRWELADKIRAELSEYGAYN